MNKKMRKSLEQSKVARKTNSNKFFGIEQKVQEVESQNSSVSMKPYVRNKGVDRFEDLQTIILENIAINEELMDERGIYIDYESLGIFQITTDFIAEREEPFWIASAMRAMPAIVEKDCRKLLVLINIFTSCHEGILDLNFSVNEISAINESISFFVLRFNKSIDTYEEENRRYVECYLNKPAFPSLYFNDGLLEFKKYFSPETENHFITMKQIIDEYLIGTDNYAETLVRYNLQQKLKNLPVTNAITTTRRKI